MYDLLIRNFNPPKYGYREIRIHPNGRITEVDECGFDEVVGMAEYIPPHGRLIDADALEELVIKQKYACAGASAHGAISELHKSWGLHNAELMIEAAPTIIQAEPN